MKPEILALFTEKIRTRAASRFGLDCSNIQTLDGFENYVAESARDGKEYILRMSHGLHRTANEIRAELDWVNFLAKNGAPVCIPLRSSNGLLVETIDNEGHTFIAVVLEKARGKYVRRDDQTSEMTRNRGRLLGQLHVLSRAYDPPEGRPRRHHWYEDEDFSDFEKFLRPGDEIVTQRFYELMDRLRSIPTNPENFGLIHMDAHTGNMFFDGDRPTLFDFDDCAHDFYASDIAISLFYAVLFLPDKWDRQEYARKFIREMMEGYREYNDLGNDWIQFLPLILKRREILLYIAVHRGMDVDNPDEWTKRYLDGRRERIEQNVSYLDLDWSDFE